MTQDEIIEMANEAGIIQPRNVIKTLEAFAKLVAQHERERFTDAAMKAAEKGIDTAIALEREACAKVCESMNKYMDDGEECATAIRARGHS
jgi:signal transduction histidine kinase